MKIYFLTLNKFAKMQLVSTFLATKTTAALFNRIPQTAFFLESNFNQNTYSVLVSVNKIKHQIYLLLQNLTQIDSYITGFDKIIQWYNLFLVILI